MQKNENEKQKNENEKQKQDGIKNITKLTGKDYEDYIKKRFPDYNIERREKWKKYLKRI